MSPTRVNEEISAVMSRPHEQNGSDVDTNDTKTGEIKLLFEKTGLSKTDLFSPFFPLHREIAAKLIDFFISTDSIDKLIKIAAYGRDNVNPNLFNYAFSVAILNRPDTGDVLLLSPAETFPDKFFNAQLFQHAIEEISVVPEGSRVK